MMNIKYLNRWDANNHKHKTRKEGGEGLKRRLTMQTQTQLLVNKGSILNIYIYTY